MNYYQRLLKDYFIGICSGMVAGIIVSILITETFSEAVIPLLLMVIFVYIALALTFQANKSNVVLIYCMVISLFILFMLLLWLYSLFLL